MNEITESARTNIWHTEFWIFDLILLLDLAHGLLVQGLGVGGGGRNVGVTGSLVGAGGELQLVGGLEVGIAGRAVGGGVILEVEKESEHFCKQKHTLETASNKIPIAFHMQNNNHPIIPLHSSELHAHLWLMLQVRRWGF